MQNILLNLLALVLLLLILGCETTPVAVPCPQPPALPACLRTTTSPMGLNLQQDYEDLWRELEDALKRAQRSLPTSSAPGTGEPTK